MEIAAVIFVLIMLGIGYITFRALKSTVKMAIRAIILFVIIGVAFAGAAALWSIGGKTPAKTPAKSRKR